MAPQLVVPVVGELTLISNSFDGDVDVDAPLILVHDRGMGEAFKAHVFEVAFHVSADLLAGRILCRGIGHPTPLQYPGGWSQTKGEAKPNPPGLTERPEAGPRGCGLPILQMGIQCLF